MKNEGIMEKDPVSLDSQFADFLLKNEKC